MMLRRWTVTLFLAVQIIGVACSWLWQHVPDQIGVPMWGAALILLVPGNFLGPWIVETLLWKTRLSLPTMGVIASILSFVIDAVVWFAVFRGLHAVRLKLRKRGSEQL